MDMNRSDFINILSSELSLEENLIRDEIERF